MFDNVLSEGKDEPPQTSANGEISITTPSVPVLVAPLALPAVVPATTLSASTMNREYPVADLVGRCFLRVCYWVDIVDSWRRTKRLPASFGMNFSSGGDFPVALKSKESPLIYDATAGIHQKLKP